MKKLTITCLSLMFTLTVFAQSPHNLLRQYKNNDGVMAIKFDGDVMGILDQVDGAEIKSELEYMDIIVFKEGTDITDADQAKLKSGLEKEKYELLVNVKDGKNRVRVMGLDNGDTISQVFINANTEKANIYVCIA